jgi:hypothetical protein
VQPVKGLDNAHRRSASPIEAARSCELEVDHQFVEVYRTEPGVRVNSGFRAYRADRRKDEKEARKAQKTKTNKNTNRENAERSEPNLG